MTEKRRSLPPHGSYSNTHCTRTDTIGGPPEREGVYVVCRFRLGGLYNLMVESQEQSTNCGIVQIPTLVAITDLITLCCKITWQNLSLSLSQA